MCTCHVPAGARMSRAGSVPVTRCTLLSLVLTFLHNGIVVLFPLNYFSKHYVFLLNLFFTNIVFKVVSNDYNNSQSF